MSSFIQFISPSFQHTISYVLYKQSHNHTAVTCQSSTFGHKIKYMPIKLEPLLVDVANEVGLFILVKRAPLLGILDPPLHCPYYSISRTILPKHTDRVPIEESPYQFWSKTDKNGRTYGATGVNLQTIFFYRR